MTTLTITPNWKNKTAKFKGTVAAGEHVAVTIANENGSGSAYITSTTNLRLNVIGLAGQLLATFPEPAEEGEMPATWGSDTGVLTCTLNLNTVQMLKAVPPAANVPLLFVLDAYSETTPEFTLYFKDKCEVEHWPRRVGEEEPVDLDGYRDFVANMESAWEEYKAGIDEDLEAQDASISALETSKADAVELAGHIADTDNPHSVTKEQLGLGNVDDTADIDKPVSSATATAIAAAKSYAAGLAAAEETRARAAESALEAGKADAEDVYTKAQVDAKEAALQRGKADLVGGKVPVAQLPDIGGKFIVVQTLPSAASADAKAIYLVPRADPETGNLYDEYIVVEDDGGTKTWDKIGSTDIDLSGYYQKPNTGIPKTDLSAGVQASLDKADTALQGVKKDGTTLTPDANKVVDIPAETKVLEFALPASCFPITYTDYFSGSPVSRIITSNAGVRVEYGSATHFALLHDIEGEAAGGYSDGFAYFTGSSSQDMKYDSCDAPIYNLLFNGVAPIHGESPTLEQKETVYVRDVQVAKQSDVLGNSGDQTLNGTLSVKHTRIEEHKIVYDVDAAGESNLKFPVGQNDYLAVLSDIYAAVQQIAPDFTAKVYAANELCSYNGVVYRCKSSYIATASSTKPNSDTTHWEAKKVSELFLPITGGTMEGSIRFRDGNFKEEYDSYRKWYLASLLGVLKLTSTDNNTILFPVASGTLALLSDTMRFSTAVSYAVGDVVFYNGAFYRCAIAHTAGAWNALHFAEVIGGLSAGTPTAPLLTAQSGDTQVANKKYVDDAVAGATPNLDYVMRVDPETGGIYYTTPDNA